MLYEILVCYEKKYFYWLFMCFKFISKVVFLVKYVKGFFCLVELVCDDVVFCVKMVLFFKLEEIK